MTAAAATPTAQARVLLGRALTVTRDGRNILDGVDVRADGGQMLAVTGPSGSGKSTLLTALAGLLPLDGGTVERSGLVSHALILQGYGLLSTLTAAENVEVALQLQRVPREDIRLRSERALERVGVDNLINRLVEEVSGGQQQRIAVARGLVMEADLLLADEPTAELDAVTRDVVVAALRAEARRGAIVVVATHDPDVAAQCDGELHLVDGRAVDRPLVG
jgi:putative ABC transport system ATP-binding protein